MKIQTIVWRMCKPSRYLEEGVNVQSFVRSFVFKGLLGAVSAMVGASAWAGAAGGGAVTFSVLDAQAVPLLSDLMVLMLVALVAVLAYRALRTGAAGRPLASVVAMGIVVAGGMLSGRLESVAQAALPLVGLTSPGGGTVTVNNVGVDVQIQNQLSKQVTIQSVTANAPNTVGNPASAPKCLPGTTVLQPSGSCYVFFVAG